MANYDDRLKDYVDVKERIRLFYERHPDGRLVTDDIWMQQDADGTVRVWGRAFAYRSPDDPLPGKGTSYMTVPGTTPYTRGSEAENVETSCWGRAIGSLGIGIDKSIASMQEVANKQDDGSEVPERTTHADGLIGTANLGKNGGASSGTDFQLRQERDGGHVIGFRLTQGRKGYKVLAFDPLASVLATQNIIGERVTCWGTMHDESFREDKTGKLITYQIMHLERIATPDMILPAAATDSPLPSQTSAEPDFCPECGGQYSDMAGHREHSHGLVEPDTIPVWEPLDEEERKLVAGGLPE